jgi:hypothetical protein
MSLPQDSRASFGSTAFTTMFASMTAYDSVIAIPTLLLVFVKETVDVDRFAFAPVENAVRQLICSIEPGFHPAFSLHGVGCFQAFKVLNANYDCLGLPTGCENNSFTGVGDPVDEVRNIALYFANTNLVCYAAPPFVVISS